MCPAKCSHIKACIVPGNSDLKLLAAWRKLRDKKYTHFIRIEYDVGIMSQSIGSLNNLVNWMLRYDLTGVRFFKYSEISNSWHWWTSLVTPEGITYININPLMTVAGYFQIMSVSVRFLQQYSYVLALGWRGHFEVLMPTVAVLSGMSMGDIKQYGEGKLLSESQFRVIHRNEESLLEVDLSKSLIHPVKSFNDYILVYSDGEFLGKKDIYEVFNVDRNSLI